MDDHIVNKTVFQLLWDSIEAINNGVDAEVILRFFEIKILRYYGVEVEWQHCVICNRDKDLVDFFNSETWMSVQESLRRRRVSHATV